MIGEILSIINGRFFDFLDGLINLSDRDSLVICPLPIAGTMLNHPAGSPKIGERMQIIRMIRCAGTQFVRKIIEAETTTDTMYLLFVLSML
jgi:hypothetical protein